MEPLEQRCVLSAAANPAVVPTPNPYPVWLTEAAQLVNLAPARSARVAFLGDSILEYFADGFGAPVWQERIARLGAVDLAVRGSTTQNLLYLIDHGLLRNLQGRVVVLMIGVNNLREGDTPDQTAAGVAACLAEIRLAQPRARVLLLGLLPVDASASDPPPGAIAQTNALLAGLADGRVVQYVNVGARFVGPDGSLVPGLISADGLHPTDLGYRIIADSLTRLLAKLADAPGPRGRG